jgi:hypothetical protein
MANDERPSIDAAHEPDGLCRPGAALTVAARAPAREFLALRDGAAQGAMGLRKVRD